MSGSRDRQMDLLTECEGGLLGSGQACSQIESARTYLAKCTRYRTSSGTGRGVGGYTP
jgi:hypothetical protein